MFGFVLYIVKCVPLVAFDVILVVFVCFRVFCMF